MAVITTGGSGDWNSATPNAPWPGGTKPTTSDTVVIASGHTVTVSTNEDTWGTSPASASAAATVTDVVLTVTGTLTITSTGTLTVRGSINGTGTVNNNSTTGLVFDATSAATPGSQNYSIKMTGGSVNATGAAGARALFTSNDGTGGRGFFNSGAYTTAFTYVRCYKMGKPGAAGTHLANWQGAACGGANWDHVEWDTCSRVDPTFTATRDCIMTSVTIKNATTTTDPFNARIGFTRATTGLREITNLCSDGTVWFNTDCHNLVVDGLLVGELMNNWVQFNSGTTAVNSVDASNMLVFAGNASGTHGFRLQAGGTYDNIYSLTGGFHTFETQNIATGVTMNLTNVIAEADGGTDAADMLVPRLNTAGNLVTINLTNAICLPNLAPAGTTGRGSGTLIAGVPTFSADYTVNITHCTQHIDANTSQGGNYLTESSGNTAIGGWMLGDFRSNLFWCDPGAVGYSAIYQNGTNRTTRNRNVDDYTYAGTVGSATATSMTVTGGANKWDYTSGTNNLFYNLALYGGGRNAYVRIISGATAPQIAAITTQGSNVSITVASWPNGTPSAGDQWEIYIPDQVAASKLDYNAYYRIGATGTLYEHNAAGTTYATQRYRDLYLTSPSLVDVHSVDLGSSGTEMTSGPMFVDSTRNSITWQTSKGVGGGSPTQTTLMQELLKCNDDSGRTLTGTLSANIAELIAYVQAGFAPQNSALATAAHDGTTIGAVAYSAPAANDDTMIGFVANVGTLMGR